MAIKHKNIEVSAKKPLFGGQSEMDKAVEKWTSEGWTLTNTTASNRKNYYLLSFEYETEEDETRNAASRRGVGCAVALGVIVALALVCNVINSGSLGKESAKPDSVAQVATQTRVVKSTESPSKSLSTQVSTIAVLKTDVALTPTVIPTQKLPTATSQPTVVLAVAKSGTINARSCASTDCAILDTIMAGETVSVLGQEDNWYLVELKDKSIGYVRTDLLFVSGITEIAILPTSKPKPSNTAAPTAFSYKGNEEQDVELIEEYLYLLTDNREIVSVKVANGRANGGARVAIIGYVTIENNQVAYLDEMLDILEAIYEVVEHYDMDLDSIALVGGNQSGEVAGALVVNVQDAFAYFEGRDSLDEFVEKWITSNS